MLPMQTGFSNMPNGDHMVKNVDTTDSTTSSACDSQATSQSSSPATSTPPSPIANKSNLKGDKTPQLHSYDSTIMGGFYEASLSKFQEIFPQWQDNWQCKENPMVMSTKQNVYDLLKNFACESKEPMMMLPSFDYGDVLNFERFLQSLKQDGINSINKYKQYLSNKDMKKFDIDLVLVHPKYGILLFEVRDCDHLDSKRRGKAKSQLNSARSCFESLIKLIVDAKGLPHDTTIPVTEFIALPNLMERPQPSSQTKPMMTTTGTTTKQQTPVNTLRQVSFMIKQDMCSQETMKCWWQQNVVDRLATRPAINSTILNFFTGILSAVKNNTVLPVVHQEHKLEIPTKPVMETMKENETTTTPLTKEMKPEMGLNISAEFFHEEHEKVRPLSKVIISSKDSEKIRRTVCMQTLWLLLNDSQKKVSVICSEQHKAVYEEYFTRQRKIYSNLTNVRFYSDIQSCALNGTTTLKKDGEVWFFDCGMNELTNDVFERTKELQAFWVFTHDGVNTNQQWKSEWDQMNVKYVDLDTVNQTLPQEQLDRKPWLSGLHLKFPLRLNCDLLVIGDIVSQNQTKLLQTFFKNDASMSAQQMNHQNGGYHNHYQQYGYNNMGHQNMTQHAQAAKKLRSIKFLRGGTIENLRTSIKMHDSIQAQVVLLHVGDEDVFKTRNSQTTIDRIKELAALVKEYCPKSFVVISTLMRRVSKSENSVTNEINKGIINYCKQTRETANFFYMLNNHFDPEYHTYEGRVLSNKGLRLYVDNIEFVVNYFLVKNHKQH